MLRVCVRRQLTPLQTLIAAGDVEALLKLVRRRCSSLTQPDEDGWIALHEAAYYGQLPCLRILLRGGRGSSLPSVHVSPFLLLTFDLCPQPIQTR